jgi:hypothetical protein
MIRNEFYPAERNPRKIRRMNICSHDFMQLLRIMIEPPADQTIVFNRPKALGLPADTILFGCEYSWDRQAFQVLLQSESFGQVPDDQMIPFHGGMQIEYEALRVSDYGGLRAAYANQQEELERLRKVVADRHGGSTLRFLVFATSYYDRSGGWDAYIGQASTVEESLQLLESQRALVEKEGINYDVWQIVDTVSCRVIESAEHKPV